jgi:hypothetical protein
MTYSLIRVCDGARAAGPTSAGGISTRYAHMRMHASQLLLASFLVMVVLRIAGEIIRNPAITPWLGLFVVLTVGLLAWVVGAWLLDRVRSGADDRRARSDETTRRG